MNWSLFLFVCTLCVTYCKSADQGNESKTYDANLDAENALKVMEDNLTIYATSAVQSNWRYFKDATKDNAVNLTSTKSQFGGMYHNWWENFLLDYDYGEVTDPKLIRQFDIQSTIGISILNDTDLLRLNSIIVNMTNTYSKKVCKYEKGCDTEDEKEYTIADIRHLLRTLNDYMELAYYWAEWRDNTGLPIVEKYPEYVDLMNLAARSNGFKHAGEMWLHPFLGANYSVDTFWENMDNLFWKYIFPYYQKLHAYVRFCLESDEELGIRINDNNHLLPVNILGSISAEDWHSLYGLIKPYPSHDFINITSTLARLHRPQQLFEIAEDFYGKIGLEKMTAAYWKYSYFEEYDNLETFCLFKSWDFYRTGESDAFRVSGCSKFTEEDLIKIHEDMLLTEYAMAYQNQPLIFRRPANPAISVGIAGAMGLSVATPQHLDKIRSALDGSSPQDEVKYDKYLAINYLFKQALKIIPNLSYMYLVEKWRWNVFNDTITQINATPAQYNYEWWKMRIQMQGLKPPFPRTPEDMDVAANENIGMNSPVFGSFLGNILQFQMYEKLCELAGHQGEFYFCDIYENHLTGSTLNNDILRNGASLPWEDQLQAFLGTKEMSAEPMIKYFEPLFEYIDNILEMHNVEVYWDTDPDQVDSYIKAPEEISAAVPITVGIVFGIMVIIVLIAFCIGQKRQKKLRDIKSKQSSDQDANVQMEERQKETPKTEGIITRLDNDTLTKRRKEAEQEIKNSLSRSDVESAINISYSGSSPESSEKRKSSGCCSEASVTIKRGNDNESFHMSESDSSRL